MPFIKPPPLKRDYRRLNIDWKDKEQVNQYWLEYRREYRKRNPGSLKSIKSMHKSRFGGNRDKVLKRDNYKCRVCGMTDKEHKRKWKREISIDHIDGVGRYSEDPNNDMSNLWTLCLSCHGRRDRYRYTITQGNKVSKKLIKELRL